MFRKIINQLKEQISSLTDLSNVDTENPAFLEVL